MRHARTAAVVLVAFCAPLAFSARLSAQEVRKITITAKKYEFTPSRVELKAGETVELTLQSEDSKHGFASKDLKLDKPSVGVVAASSDESTSTNLLNPEQMKYFTLRDLQMLKTPYGREYLGIAQSVGPIWGVT